MRFFVETPCGDVKGAAYEATGWSSPCRLAHALYLKNLQEYYLIHALHSGVLDAIRLTHDLSIQIDLEHVK